MWQRHLTIALLCSLLLAAAASCSGGDRALERVLSEGVLRVGMDASFPPFEYVDAEGNLAGFDVDLAHGIAERMSAQYDRPLEVQFVANLPYDGLYDALTTDRVDVVISALYVDPARMDSFAYSRSYFNAGQVLVVAGDEEELQGMADLAGRTLAVEFGSAGDVVARRWARRLADLTVLPCQTPAEALAKVGAGEADAALVDHLSALAGMGAGDELRITPPPVTDEPYAAAVERDNGRLLQGIDEALEDLENDGTLEELKARWFHSG
jgi:polar amino acid transport system substrate-binding protein